MKMKQALFLSFFKKKIFKSIPNLAANIKKIREGMQTLTDFFKKLENWY